MLAVLARYHWVYREHPGYHRASWAFYSPGVRKDYEPLWIPKLETEHVCLGVKP